ncbi:uncharacterized protein K452DRAFT_270118 [Aplosporella prunicola CBS 121167]|uniref:Uncharacterized protein n=1 Tax=Aplosporella prunicola CBS 121167 TaxID=1176127 RepID=A0A6A6BIQ7_9PEZI|nr:uncharacterized protein K452DRAFT_270118 [Aplosporella prunicola CBS 121167]KAF2142451.1 hypothetical protein K452DRAFT_270118 [Aplosporella prunicola CBS 121167]
MEVSNVLETIFGSQANGTTSWQPEPTTRGTFSILSTCLVTLSLCVWTAVHLNIPAYGQVDRQKWRKLRWLTFTLFAPELVILTAYHQRKSAKKALEIGIKTFGQEPHDSFPLKVLRYFRKVVPPPQNDVEVELTQSTEFTRDSEITIRSIINARHPWTMVHGHYVAMGGLAVEFHLGSAQTRRIVLTVDAFKAVLDKYPSSMLELSESHIKDKSKANTLAKTLVCIQALWFCIQCFSRMGQRLSISLLELNTLGHAICALLMYLLWWDKPLDVGEPTLLQEQGVKELVALFSLSNKSKKGWDIGHKDSYTGVETKSPVVYFTEASGNIDSYITPPFDFDFEAPNEHKTYKLYMGFSLYGFCFNRPSEWPKSSPRDRIFLDRPYITLDTMDLICWKMAAEAVRRHYPQDPSRPTLRSSWRLSQQFEKVVEWVPDSISETLDSIESSYSLAFSGIIYGGLHLLAWNAPFLTFAEKFLWRFSSLAVASAVVFLGLFHFVRLYASMKVGVPTKNMFNNLFDKSHNVIYTSANLSFHFLAYFFPLIYVFSRIYLVVECFLQFRHLPDSVFLVPTWSQYVPHIS